MARQKHYPVYGDELAEERRNSVDGALHRALGKSDVIPPRYRDDVWRNPDGILGSPHLPREIKAVKKIIRALKERSQQEEYENLRRKLRAEIPGHRYTSPVCPVARHLHSSELLRELAFFFGPLAFDEFILDTTIHGFSPTLSGTDKVITDARDDIELVRDEMFRHGVGLIELGAFEPDLRHIDEFEDKKALKRLSEKLGWDVPDTGGYVVSSHRLVRVDDYELYRRIVKKKV